MTIEHLSCQLKDTQCKYPILAVCKLEQGINNICIPKFPRDLFGIRQKISFPSLGVSWQTITMRLSINKSHTRKGNVDALHGVLEWATNEPKEVCSELDQANYQDLLSVEETLRLIMSRSKLLWRCLLLRTYKNSANFTEDCSLFVGSSLNIQIVTSHLSNCKRKMWSSNGMTCQKAFDEIKHYLLASASIQQSTPLFLYIFVSGYFIRLNKMKMDKKNIQYITCTLHY